MISLVQARRAQQNSELPEEENYGVLGIRKRRAHWNHIRVDRLRPTRNGWCSADNRNIVFGMNLRIVEDFHSEDGSLLKNVGFLDQFQTCTFKFVEAVFLMHLMRRGIR